jgi:hypothetical protein
MGVRGLRKGFIKEVLKMDDGMDVGNSNGKMVKCLMVSGSWVGKTVWDNGTPRRGTAMKENGRTTGNKGEEPFAIEGDLVILDLLRHSSSMEEESNTSVMVMCMLAATRTVSLMVMGGIVGLLVILIKAILRKDLGMGKAVYS